MTMDRVTTTPEMAILNTHLQAAIPLHPMEARNKYYIRGHPFYYTDSRSIVIILEAMNVLFSKIGQASTMMI